MTERPAFQPVLRDAAGAGGVARAALAGNHDRLFEPDHRPVRLVFEIIMVPVTLDERRVARFTVVSRDALFRFASNDVLEPLRLRRLLRIPLIHQLEEANDLHGLRIQAQHQVPHVDVGGVHVKMRTIGDL